MNMTVVLSVYVVIAAFFTSYTFYFAVLDRPRPAIFTFTDHAILALTSLSVGALWVLFVPGLGVVAARQVGRYLLDRPRGLSLPRTEQARAGS